MLPDPPGPGAPQPPPQRWPDTLRHRLLLYLVIALLPIAIANVVQGLLLLDRERAAARDRLVSIALSATGEQENAFAGADHVLRALAGVPAIRSPEAGCPAMLSNVLLGLPWAANIARVDGTGNIVCAAVGQGQPTSVADMDWWRRLKAEDGLTISGRRFGRLSQRDIVIVAHPLEDGALVVAVEVGWLDRALQHSELPEGALIGLIGRDGTVVAGDDRAGVETLIAPHVAAAPAPDGAIMATVEDADGREWSYAIAPILDAQAFVGIAMPSDRLFSWTYVSVTTSLLLPLLMVGLALATIWFASERLVVRWLGYLRRVTAAYAAGHYAFQLNRIRAAPAEFRVLGQSVVAMADAVRERDRHLREALAQKTALAREIHHRIKNSLQIVTSLLSLQSAQVRDPEARFQFEVVRGRIEALALAHRLIHEADRGSQVEMRDLLSELAAQHANAAPRGSLRIDVRTIDCPLPTDLAVPLALLVHEVLSGLRPPTSADRQRVTLTVERGGPEMLRLMIAAEGAPRARLQAAEACTLIEGFVGQLRGTTAAMDGPECESAVTVTFPDRAAHEPAANP